jgi:DNA-binding response OmpR family regulator
MLSRRMAGSEGGARGGDLLVVENDERIAELLTWFLVRRGHCVRNAATFAEARAMIRERRPDLVLSDVDLGGESARRELPKLAAAGELPPTLVVSGLVDGELASEFAALPDVVGVIHKPFEFERLEAAISSFLVRRRRAAETSAHPR